MRIILATVSALTMAVAAPLIAAAQQAHNPQAAVATVKAGSYTVDGNHTFVTLTVDHFGFTPLSGMFGGIQGTLSLDPQNLGKTAVDVTVPVANPLVASDMFKGHLLHPGENGAKPTFFGPNPAAAHFVSTAVKVTGKTTADLSGNLTLNGVTKPVTLNVAFYGAGKSPPALGGKDNVGFTATTTVKRSDFGLGAYAPYVSDETELKIVAAFEK